MDVVVQMNEKESLDSQFGKAFNQQTLSLKHTKALRLLPSSQHLQDVSVSATKSCTRLRLYFVRHLTCVYFMSQQSHNKKKLQQEVLFFFFFKHSYQP